MTSMFMHPESSSQGLLWLYSPSKTQTGRDMNAKSKRNRNKNLFNNLSWKRKVKIAMMMAISSLNSVANPSNQSRKRK